MTVVELVLLLAVAGLCGALGRLLVRGAPPHWLLSIALGLAGAWVGFALARAFDLPPLLVLPIEGGGFPLVWATLGAALLVGLLSLLRRAKP